MALESERVLDSLPDHEIEELRAEELKADIEEFYEHEHSERDSKLEKLIKLALVVAACVVVVYSGTSWYENHQQVARELETVPPPPKVITDSGLFDIDKSSNNNPQIGGNSQQVSLQSIN